MHDRTWIATFCVFFAAAHCHHAPAQETKVDFTRDIRPIFSNKCFACHGPDAKTRAGGFRLDERQSVFGEADSGEHPIVAGDLENSEVIRRIMATDSDKMPPSDSDFSLTQVEITRIQQWVSQGATWQDHWAFLAPVKSPIPVVKNTTWPSNDVDRFTLAKMESIGMQPNRRAAKTTLVRRLYFDLIGIPPSLEEIDQFLNDDSQDAYENLVDRLLASQHYGEHMASAWLDAARFADTNGYQNDFARSMWPWRDWVIEAFNQNMRFDQFTIEQLAGDLLPEPTLDQIIATGFNRNHRTVTEGGSIDAEWHVENLVDRVETTATVFMGLTMGCARCHDHKYDPITQREFYQFFAFFNSIDEKGVHNEARGNVPPLIEVPGTEHKKKLADLDAKIVLALANAKEVERRQLANRPKWELDLVARTTVLSMDKPHVSLLDPTANSSQEDITRILKDAEKTHDFEDSFPGRAIKFSETKPAPLSLENVFQFDATKAFSCSAWIKPDSFGAILSRMDKDNAYRGFDMLISDDGHLDVHLIHDWPGNAIKISTSKLLIKKRWSHVVVVYDGSGKAAGFTVFINKRVTQFKIQTNNLNGTTLTEHPLWIGLREATPDYRGLISDIRLFDDQLTAASVEELFFKGITTLVKKAAGKRTNDEQDELKFLYLSSATDQQTNSQAELDKLRKSRSDLERNVPTVMIMKELETPRATYVLARGQYDKPLKDDVVMPGFPASLPQPAERNRRLTRLDLARWLTSSDNPLMARVTVNRLWNRLFGSGLLETIENFGVQSPQPSHRELLDWLAVGFVDSGWNVKQLLKTIVLSETYRQSSSASPELFARDPVNRLLARGSRFRLPAESIRDNALAISGLLERHIGGESIKPYQPKGLWKELAGGAGEKPYVQETDRKLYRRSLYIYRKRTVPHSTMSTFDAASRDVCQVARQRTNTPLQALALLNDKTYVESARHLATRVILRNPTAAERLRDMFRMATSRRPNATEFALLDRSLNRATARFRKSPDAAMAFISIGLSDVDKTIEPTELAAYTVVASVILNLDETITRE